LEISRGATVLRLPGRPAVLSPQDGPIAPHGGSPGAISKRHTIERPAPAITTVTSNATGSATAPVASDACGSTIAAVTSNTTGSAIAAVTSNTTGSAIAAVTSNTTGSAIAAITTRARRLAASDNTQSPKCEHKQYSCEQPPHDSHMTASAVPVGALKLFSFSPCSRAAFAFGAWGRSGCV
jgi:hypothetical protein